MGELIRVAVDASISEKCGAIVEEKTTKYDRFVDNFAAFFNNEDIQDRLDRKVEVEEFNILKNEIALKSDVMKSRKMVGILNHRLQQVSILNAEIAKSL